MMGIQNKFSCVHKECKTIDRDPTSIPKDSLHGIGGPMTRAKTKKMQQALQGLIMELKEKEDQDGLEAAPKWVTFLQLNGNDLSPT